MFLLASILLEPNRWTPGRVPSIWASDWSDRALAAGFDGWELFENHYRLASDGERKRLSSGALPVRIFNSYQLPGDRAGAWGTAVATAEALGASGMKFNLGKEREHWAREREAISECEGSSVRLLCECHPGTSLEDPEAVLEFVGDVNPWPFDLMLHPFLLGPEGIARWMNLLGSHIRHAHAQMRDPTDDRRILQLADDAPRAEACLAALAETGFQGSFSVEFAAPTQRADESPETLFAAAVKDLEFLREHWRS